MKNKKVITAIIVLILLGIGGVTFLVIRRQRQNPQTKKDSIGTQASQAVKEAVSGYVKESFPLRKGMRGENVKKLQTALMMAGLDVGPSGADGKLGENTLWAIRIFFNSPMKFEVSETEFYLLTNSWK